MITSFQKLSRIDEIETIVVPILFSMAEHGFDDNTIQKIRVALTELLVNALIHGNKVDDSKNVLVHHSFEHDKIAISVMDEGDGFDIHHIPDPTLSENLMKNHGRGLYIVSKYSDKVESNPKGNCIKIYKSKNYT